MMALLRKRSEEERPDEGGEDRPMGKWRRGVVAGACAAADDGVGGCVKAEEDLFRVRVRLGQVEII